MSREMQAGKEYNKYLISMRSIFLPLAFASLIFHAATKAYEAMPVMENKTNAR